MLNKVQVKVCGQQCENKFMRFTYYAIRTITNIILNSTPELIYTYECLDALRPRMLDIIQDLIEFNAGRNCLILSIHKLFHFERHPFCDISKIVTKGGISLFIIIVKSQS